MARPILSMILLTLCCAPAVISAQDSPLITAATVERLASAQRIDFDSLPPDAGTIRNGWFALSPDARWLALMNTDGALLLWDIRAGADPALVGQSTISGGDSQPTTILDAAFSPDSGLLASLHTDGAGYIVGVYTLDTGTLQRLPLPETPDFPAALWVEAGSRAVWLEVLTADPRQVPYVLRLPLDPSEAPETLPAGPDADAETVARIGRIPQPTAITATADQQVKLWDLESGAVEATAQVEALAMFGSLDAQTGTRLAWRDPESTELRLLDFTDGTDRLIAPLDGVYVQALLITPDADVILGVAVDFTETVVAWEIDSGAQIDLGEFHTCGRSPDMIRLSHDGSALVIGCATGIDIWRIADDN
ncbi:MAG: WD40 repeat domain-containing protein [Chloroflexi bacterium]|nr:WD40 repeat domain-containing protein [Chloroflexota bacterium]